MKSILFADNSVHIAVVLRMPARCTLDKQVQDFYAIKLLPKAFGGTKFDQCARAIPNIKNDHYDGTITFALRCIGDLPVLCKDLPLILPGGGKRNRGIKVSKGAIRIIGTPICKKCSFINSHDITCADYASWIV